MGESKKIDQRQSLRVVTDNSVINAEDLATLSLNARKLLYIAIAQCKMSDSEFYEYETTPAELADIWGITRSNVYRESDNITSELMKTVIRLPDGVRGYKKRHLFEICDYNDDSVVKFKLNKEMTNKLLGLEKDFSKPLMWDFMRMRSPYSISIWHLMQMEMKSFKPMMSAPIEFDLSLEELRRVTGTEKKLKQVGQFKERVLDKAIEEIRKNCWTDISYVNIKKGRVVTGFRFTAKSIMGNIKMDDLSFRQQKQARKAMLIHKKAEGTLTPLEYNELQELISELSQMSIEDYM